LVPPLQSWPVARENGLSLSLTRYLFGWRTAPNGNPPQTHTFATVDGRPLLLDAYLPSGTASGLRPALIVVHGGSWSGGDKSDFPQWDHWLTQQGFAVFDVQYRLAPQPNWQTATGDIKCAIGWVKRHAAQYGVDPQRIALLGRSAGGHLALLAAYTPDDPALPPSCAAADTSVRAVVSLYGPADLVWGYTHQANPDVIDGPGTLRRFLGGDPQTAAAAFTTAAPISHVGSRTPPTLLLHGQRDQLVGARHAELLAERLRAANVPHRTILIPYAQHGFDYNFDGWGAQIVQPVLLQFLQTYVAP
jgi:acetyl esterase/lipase